MVIPLKVKIYPLVDFDSLKSTIRLHYYTLQVQVDIDCPKITEDKSSESRVQTPGVRLIIATSVQT